MKTSPNFHKDFHSELRRLKTIGPELNLTLNKSNSNIKSKMRQRIKSMMNIQIESQIHSPLSPKYKRRVLTFCKTTKNNNANKIEIQDQDNQYLTMEFAADWKKGQSHKLNTFRRLRNKFVQEFPEYRQKYKIDELDQEDQKCLQNNKISRSHSSEKKQTQSVDSKENKINLMKATTFYSRSKNKCIYNIFTHRQPESKKKQIPIPRMTFMNYIRQHQERKKLKVNKIRGVDLIQKKDKILNLQKEGTQLYASLKKSLQDAIQTYIRSQ